MARQEAWQGETAPAKFLSKAIEPNREHDDQEQRSEPNWRARRSGRERRRLIQPVQHATGQEMQSERREGLGGRQEDGDSVPPNAHAPTAQPVTKLQQASPS